jgi:hypothetical protein
VKVLLRLSLAILISGAFAAQGETLFSDNFSVQGTQLNTASWTTVPGLTVGRTQLSDWVTPGAGGQFVVGSGGAELSVDTYNANNTSTLLGTQAETLQEFTPDDGSTLSFTTVLQLTSLQPGLVYSMYLYGANADEIDIELPTNLLQSGSPLQVELNRFTAGSPDTGDGGLVDLPDGFDPLAAHSWTIEWSLSQISYLVDGTLLASVDTRIPQSELQANILGFAPNSNWGTAYNSALQPAGSAQDNSVFTALVTSVDISETTPEPATWAMLSGALLLGWWLRMRAARRAFAAVATGN